MKLWKTGCQLQVDFILNHHHHLAHFQSRAVLLERTMEAPPMSTISGGQNCRRGTRAAREGQSPTLTEYRVAFQENPPLLVKSPNF
jgi:hypothetical protein